MTMTTTTVPLTKLLTFGAVLGLLVLILGGAVAERMERRALEDRLWLGELGSGDSRSLINGRV